MLCPACSVEELICHRTNEALITLCPRCGYEGKEVRSPPREKWTAEERIRRVPPKPAQKPRKK
jgi:Zn ribbon nucleic-acid-binding protein